MSPGWWDRWRPPRHPVMDGTSDPTLPSAVPAGSTNSPPLVVLLPSDWSNLWNQIRHWQETSSATRVRVSILPPLGPRHFLVDSEASSRIDVFATADIMLGKTFVGRVELGYPVAETTPSVADAEARHWAEWISLHLATGFARQDPPSQAA